MDAKAEQKKDDIKGGRKGKAVNEVADVEGKQTVGKKNGVPSKKGDSQKTGKDTKQVVENGKGASGDAGKAGKGKAAKDTTKGKPDANPQKKDTKTAASAVDAAVDGATKRKLDTADTEKKDMTTTASAVDSGASKSSRKKTPTEGTTDEETVPKGAEKESKPTTKKTGAGKKGAEPASKKTTGKKGESEESVDKNGPAEVESSDNGSDEQQPEKESKSKKQVKGGGKKKKVDDKQEPMEEGEPEMEDDPISKSTEKNSKVKSGEAEALPTGKVPTQEKGAKAGSKRSKVTLPTRPLAEPATKRVLRSAKNAKE